MMIIFEKWKIFLIAAVCLMGAVFASPNLFDEDIGFLPESRINLGLDLQGGSYLLLQVDTDVVIRERLEDIAETIRLEMRESRIGIRDLRASDTDVSFRIRDAEDAERARELLGTIVGSDISVSVDRVLFSLSYTESGIDALVLATVGQAIEIVRNRIDETGTKEPIIQRQGRARILLQLPGVDDPEAVKRLLGRTARLGFQLVDTSRSGIEVQESGRVPPGSELLPAADGSGEVYLVRKRVLVSGDMLDDASPGFGENNNPVVNFTLNATGGARFGRVTGQNIGKPFAIVLDDEVVSAPVIRAQIFSNGQISGNFSVQETDELSLLLRAGALPAPLSVLEERSVGPGLGSDSIAAGKIATIIGMIGVVAFTILTYGAYGVLATIALSINMMLIIAALSVLQATLTLPGIAGIVLTMGMAVDANVLIFERIREECLKNRTIADAVNTGFKQATSTIIDANLTTLVAVLFLYGLGSGPIKGFSVTLGLGVLTSMFSAVMITRMLVILWINARRPKKLLL